MSDRQTAMCCFTGCVIATLTAVVVVHLTSVGNEATMATGLLGFGCAVGGVILHYLGNGKVPPNGSADRAPTKSSNGQAYGD